MLGLVDIVADLVDGVLDIVTPRLRSPAVLDTIRELDLGDVIDEILGDVDDEILDD